MHTILWVLSRTFRKRWPESTWDVSSPWVVLHYYSPLAVRLHLQWVKAHVPWVVWWLPVPHTKRLATARGSSAVWVRVLFSLPWLGHLACVQEVKPCCLASWCKRQLSLPGTVVALKNALCSCELWHERDSSLAASTRGRDYSFLFLCSGCSLGEETLWW